jgi:hypothetical protein
MNWSRSRSKSSLKTACRRLHRARVARVAPCSGSGCRLRAHPGVGARVGGHGDRRQHDHPRLYADGGGAGDRGPGDRGPPAGLSRGPADRQAARRAGGLDRDGGVSGLGGQRLYHRPDDQREWRGDASLRRPNASGSRRVVAAVRRRETQRSGHDRQESIDRPSGQRTRRHPLEPVRLPRSPGLGS